MPKMDMQTMSRRWFIFQSASVILSATRVLSRQTIWTKLEAVTLAKHKYYDGDSFYLESRTLKQLFNFRLYGVDCPETDDIQVPERFQQQADYFGVSKPDLLTWARVARRFTERFLEDSVIAYTTFQDAMGRGRTPRHYVYVFSGDRSLGESLIKAGLARAHGFYADFENRHWHQIRENYERLETLAKEERRGIWSASVDTP